MVVSCSTEIQMSPISAINELPNLFISLGCVWFAETIILIGDNAGQFGGLMCYKASQPGKSLLDEWLQKARLLMISGPRTAGSMQRGDSCVGMSSGPLAPQQGAPHYARPPLQGQLILKPILGFYGEASA